MLKRLLARLIGPKPPGFQFEVVDEMFWRCLLCHPQRIVPTNQLAFHASSKHGWRAPAVTIKPPHRHTATCE